MSEAIYTLASSALDQQKRLEMLANNLANSTTLGFKQDLAVFHLTEESTGQTVAMTAPEAAFVLPRDLDLSMGTASATCTDFSQGAMRHSGNRLDLALDGRGFFCIQTDDGVQYMRRGNFSLNADGLLVTDAGLPVLGEGGEITVQGHAVTVDEDGSLTVDGALIDKLRIVDFPDDARLEKQGESLFAPQNPDTASAVPENTRVKQGFVELSNVDPIRVMTEMIEVLRGYEAYQKVIQSVDEIDGQAVSEVGGVS